MYSLFTTWVLKVSYYGTSATFFPQQYAIESTRFVTFSVITLITIECHTHEPTKGLVVRTLCNSDAKFLWHPKQTRRQLGVPCSWCAANEIWDTLVFFCLSSNGYKPWNVHCNFRIVAEHLAVRMDYVLWANYRLTLTLERNWSLHSYNIF